MSKELFWKMLAETYEISKGEPNNQVNLLIDKLSEYPPEEIIEFQDICDEFMNRAYLASLWEAACVICCGCSDDGFIDFRAWLIQQGKDIYEAALQNPEILADIVDDGLQTREGGLWYVPIKAYENKTSQSIPPKRYINPLLEREIGNQAEIFARFPRLVAKFGDCNEP